MSNWLFNIFLLFLIANFISEDSNKSKRGPLHFELKGPRLDLAESSEIKLAKKKNDDLTNLNLIECSNIYEDSCKLKK